MSTPEPIEGRRALLYIGADRAVEGSVSVTRWDTHALPLPPIEAAELPGLQAFSATIETSLVMDPDGPVTFECVPERVTTTRSRNFRRRVLSGRLRLTGPEWTRLFAQRLVFIAAENTRRPRREARRARKRRQR
jgi:hypothetical protein